jgi:hypothetical protein
MNELNKNQLIQKINLENKITNIETFSTFILLFEFLFKQIYIYFNYYPCNVSSVLSSSYYIILDSVLFF